MSKKVQKTLTGAMAAMMATGVVATPAMAATNNTDVDALYKAAYQATQKALTEKTQAAVNEAREAIKALPANLDWAIGEFSKQVDTVQHPILVEIVTAIKKLDEEATQANINAAKKAIPAELRDEWKKSYSAAIDVHQQALITKANEAVKEAQAVRSDAAIKVANELLAELATADAQGVKDWAATMQDRVDSIEKYAIQITKVNVIDRFQVEVEFEATTENLKNVTVEVIDANGNKKEVAPKSLLKGSKSTVFDFVTVNGAAELAGVWTVNGIKVDVTEISLVKDMLEDAKYIADLANKHNSYTTSFSSLAKLQEKGYINGLLGEYNNQNYFVFDRYEDKFVASEYAKALADKKVDIDNAADVQAVIDAVNKSLAGHVTVAELVELAESGDVTSKQFASAMASLDLAKVNEDWADAYKTEIANLSANDKLEKVQDVVYAVNKDKITAKKEQYTLEKYVSADIKAERNKAEEVLTLAEEYYKDDAEKVTEKADLLKAIKIELALFDVKLVSDVTDLEAALKNVSETVNNADKFSFDKNVNTKLMEEYFKNGLNKITSLDNLKSKLTSVQTSVAYAEIEKVHASVNEDKLIEALKSEKLGLTNIIEANKSEYFADKLVIDNTNDYESLTKAIKAINARVDMKNATNKTEMRAAFVTLVENRDSNILLNKSTNQITDIAEEFLNLRNDEEITLVNIRNIIGGVGSVDTEFAPFGIEFMKVEDTIIEKLANVSGDNNKVSTEELKDALEAIVGKGNIKTGMLEDFVKASNGKTYTDYTAIRKALGL